MTCSEKYSVMFLRIVHMCFVTTEDKTRDQNQDQDKKPLPQQNLCNEMGCYSHRGEEAERSTISQELPALFSLAALAEVAAMENIHR